MARQRIRDAVLVGLDVSSRPYGLREGTLSGAYKFLPVLGGGYRRANQWATHWAAPAGEEVIGVSPVGAIEVGSAPQITVATANPSTNVLRQYKVLADGTGTEWGMVFGFNQDTTRRRIVYFRTVGREYVLGFVPYAYNYKSHLFLSMYVPVGAEPINQSAMSVSTGSGFFIGYSRVYAVFRNTPSSPYGYSGVGAIDRVNTKDVAVYKMPGTLLPATFSFSGIPVGSWPTTSHVYLYRTPIVKTSVQLPSQTAYLLGSVANGTTTFSSRIFESELLERAKLEIGKYDFPGNGESNVFQDNLNLWEHLGFLMCSGVKYDYRIYIGGYLAINNAVVRDPNWWTFFVDLPNRDKVLAVASVRGRLIVLGQDGFYRLRDDETLPSAWSFERIGTVRGKAVDAGRVVGVGAAFIVRDGLGQWGTLYADGYNIDVEAAEMSSVLDSSTIIIDLDGSITLASGAQSHGFTKAVRGRWGHCGLPSGAKWSVGRDSSFQSDKVLVGATGGIYYYNSSYETDGGGAYIVSRAYSTVLEERSEWEIVFLIASPSDISNPPTVSISAATDDGPFTAVGNIVIDKLSGIYRVGLPPALKQGKTLRVKVASTDANGVEIYGIIVQVRVPPAMA